jgi:AbrB family looped-hinge helix DNA binding protein
MGKVSRVTIDQSGQVIIPEDIRMRLGMSPGSLLIIEERGDREVILRPLPKEPRLANKGGVLVVQSEAIGEIADLVGQDREARVSQLVQGTGL